MLRVCQDCQKTYHSVPAKGGSLPLTYKVCPHCGSKNTADTATSTSKGITKGFGPPNSTGHSFNRKKPGGR